MMSALRSSAVMRPAQRLSTANATTEMQRRLIFTFFPRSNRSALLSSRLLHSSASAASASLARGSPAPFEPAVPLSYGTYREGPLSRSELEQYNRDGFIIKRQFYSPEEMGFLLRIAKSDRDLTSHAIDVPDASGKKSKLSVWNYLGEDDIYSMIGRGDRMVGVMEQILGDEPYHYHSKMMLKEPKVGGAWEWHQVSHRLHTTPSSAQPRTSQCSSTGSASRVYVCVCVCVCQDYGYWYKNGVLAPRLASGLIAVDKATKANGCLQVLRGSHHFGRIEHNVAGGQTGVDMDFLEAIAAQCEKVYIECGPGDVLFFHCNLLHASAPNESDYPRWSLICCFNARSNDPIRKSHHPNYHPLHRVPDSAIVEYGRRWTERVERGETIESSKERIAAFLDPDDDESTPASTKSEGWGGGAATEKRAEA